MDIIKQRLTCTDESGNTNVVHLETGSNSVLRPDGVNTVEGTLSQINAELEDKTTKISTLETKVNQISSTLDTTLTDISSLLDEINGEVV